MTACHDVASAPVAVAGIRRVALVGSPNAGKTSVFNQLTGLRAKTGNYPGVTVGRSVGTTNVDGVAIAVEDLPGTYSLDPISPDEQVVADLLAGKVYDGGHRDAQRRRQRLDIDSAAAGAQFVAHGQRQQTRQVQP